MREVNIVTYSDYRRIARDRLQGNRALSIGIAAVACVLGGLITGSTFLPDVSYNIPIHFPALESFAAKPV